MMLRSVPGRAARVTLAVTLLAAAGCLVPAPSWGGTIELPRPESEQLAAPELLAAIGAVPDRLPVASTPGPVSSDELVEATVRGDSRLVAVTVTQRLRLSGRGDYQIRESGPVLAAAPLPDADGPVLDFGDAVWQGYCANSRELGARLTLDPVVEAAHLPLAVSVSFTARGGRPTPLLSDAVPGPGTVTVTVVNRTARDVPLPTALDGPAAATAAALDRLRGAVGDAAAALPTTRTTVPAELVGTAGPSRTAHLVVPLRVRAALRLQPAADDPVGTTVGSSADRVVTAATTLTLAVGGAGRLALDLQAGPQLPAGALTPPGSRPSWASWAAAAPPRAERAAAVDALIGIAAIGARASAFSPYLGWDTGDVGTTAFRFRLAPAAGTDPVARATGRSVLWPVALWSVLGLLLAGLATFVWRRS